MREASSKGLTTLWWPFTYPAVCTLALVTQLLSHKHSQFLALFVGIARHTNHLHALPHMPELSKHEKHERSSIARGSGVDQLAATASYGLTVPGHSCHMKLACCNRCCLLACQKLGQPEAW